MNLENINCAKK